MKLKIILPAIFILSFSSVAFSQFLSPFSSYDSSSWDTYGGAYGGGGGGYSPSYGTIIDSSIYGSKSGTSGGTGTTGGSGTSGGSDTGSSGSGTGSGSAFCRNSIMDLTLPKGAMSVKLKDAAGQLTYLGGSDIVKTLDPKGGSIYAQMLSSSKKIVMTRIENERELVRELGEITVDGDCYPKYGYIYPKKLWWDYDENAVKSSSPATSPNLENGAVDLTIPENRTAVNVDSATGKVFHALTGELIADARYDASKNSIFYKDTDSYFGTMLTKTYGYVNVPPSYFDSGAQIAAEGAVFRDVLDSDTHILGFVDIMAAKKIYKLPRNKKFYPEKATDADFAIKVLAAVSGKGCGSKKIVRTSKKCGAYLVKKGVIDGDFPKGKAAMFRGAFFESIFKAAGIPLEKSTGENRNLVKTACSDAENPSDVSVSVMATAIRLGLAKSYDGKCKLLDAFSRSEAAEFAMKLIK